MAEHKLKKFHEFELDLRVQKAIAQLGWSEPTLIQATAIPLLLEGKDVLVRARTGAGKTAAYALPLIQKILNSKMNATEQRVTALVLAPTKELCRQSGQVIEQLTEACSRVVRVADISGSCNDPATQRHALSERPDIVVATPGRLLTHAQAGSDIIDLKHIETLVVDEADLVFAFGYEKDFKKLLKLLPPIYQAVLVSATLSEDVVRMKGLCLNNPVTLKLEEPDLVPQDQLTHQRILAEENDKPAILCALLKLQLIRGKSIIFVNNVDRCYKLRLFLEQFGIRSCALNAELPANIRIHTISQFNRGIYDIIIASDEQMLVQPGNKKRNNRQGRRQGDHESSSSRGIDFQSVNNVINFDFPIDVNSYIHRAGRTARGTSKGAVLSFVSLKEMPVNDAVEQKLRTTFALDIQIIKNYQFKMEEVEPFRYRAQDCWRAASRIAVHDTRMREIKNEILNCEKLKSFFEENQRDLQALRHDKPLKTIKVQAHLAHVPDYIVPKTLKRCINTTATTGAVAAAAAAPQRVARTGGGGGGGGGGSAKAAFERKSNDPLMVSQIDYGKKKGAPAARKRKKVL